MNHLYDRSVNQSEYATIKRENLSFTIFYLVSEWPMSALHLTSLSNLGTCSRLFQVRGKLYELLINCIPPEIILKVNAQLRNCSYVFCFPYLTSKFVFGGSEASS